MIRFFSLVLHFIKFPGLLSGQLSGRDNADAVLLPPHTKRGEKQFAGGAKTDNDKTVLPFRVDGIIVNDGVFVKKDRFGLLKRDAVFSDIFPVLLRVP